MLPKRISVEQAGTLHQSGQSLFVDVRDADSYQTSQIEGAIHLDSESILSFVNDTDKSKPLVVYCYHGVSSVDAAQYLCHQGFEDVSTLEGGFEAWESEKG